MMRPRIAILTQQIGHYHDARYRAATQRFPDLVVVSIANQGEFNEFLARNIGGYDVRRVFEDRGAYIDAVRAGSLDVKLKAVLNEVAPTTVCVAGWAGAESFSAIDWARSMGARTVMMSESQAHDASRSRLREQVKARVVGMCDAALVGGPSHSDYMLSLGMPIGQISLGYNAVDVDYFARGADAARRDPGVMRKRVGAPPNYVLASARFIEKKNLPLLVKAYGRAAQTQHGAPDLVILGDGPLRGEIDAAIAAEGLTGRVHAPGFAGYGDLPIWYGLARGFVHVSRTEQWGLVVNEAMASGLPVIVSKTCGVASAVLSGAGKGWQVDPLNVDDIESALRALFKLSPAEREAMGRRARAAIEQWGPDRFSAGLAGAVEAALARPLRGRLAPWDRALLKMLARSAIDDVQ